MRPLATPSPSPSATPGSVDDAVHGALEWFLGVPLNIVLIVVISSIVLALLRRTIRTITSHVADGKPMIARTGLQDTGVGSALLRADPLASARRTQRARTLDSVLRSTATILVGGIALFLVLDALGVNIAPFIASAGIVGVALGFGAQSLVKDFLTGTFMLLEDQYGVGDVIDAGPASGTVEAVTLRVTKIRDADGTLWYIPNGSMLRVGNKTQGWATAVVEVDVDYFADIDRVRSLLEEAAASVAADPDLGPELQGDPVITGIERLSADAVTMRLKVRTSPAKQWEVARALRVATRGVLESAGIPLAGQHDRMAAHLAEREPGSSSDDGLHESIEPA
ncbi:mechanosensitive ion channel family protein [Cellulomonas edaphi]|uniref:Mechanosensitive ion channel family protein n=1 Tax=Cellulomonas edaphi TaxID=3053468 RepID=A0ABT7SAH0_9CELL|nr:mechanosensitive ion channel family protein [Cellulomons edaphi]MDM7832622.1 mechanosensitive ion channel family protein [Cellulomons edaphi]